MYLCRQTVGQYGANLAIVIQMVSIIFNGNVAQDDNYSVKPITCGFIF